MADGNGSSRPAVTADAGPSRLSASGGDNPATTTTATTQRPQSLESVYRRRSAFSFPRAAQPEIVRAYQKDVYYRELLQTQLQDVVRGMLGSRTLFAHADTISFFGSLAYFTLSTFGGAQTLGEEYVNAMMTDGRTGRIVAVRRRMLFIMYYVVAPFAASRAYSATRRRLIAAHQARSQALQRARLRAAAVAPRRGEAPPQPELQPSWTDRIVGTLAERLPTMDAFTTSSGILAYLGAAHLALFYLGGRYYKFSQRLARTEYISTIARRPGSKPPSYEVLGFLLGMQLFIKVLMQANRWRSAWMQQRKLAQQGGADATAVSSTIPVASATDSVQIDDTLWSHKTTPPTRATGNAEKARKWQVPLVFPDPDGLASAQELGLPSDVSRPQLEAARAAAKVKAAELEAVSESVLRCTLCMEQREPQKGTSAVTECGHVFCWDCIVGWSREKLECPLCRQSLNPSHLLPIYNF